MAIKVWHEKHEPNDILVRLVNDRREASIEWIDLVRTHEDGSVMYGHGILYFNTSNGKILYNKNGAKLYGGEKPNLPKTLPQSDIPYFKIWHNKHKAHFRLRLLQMVHFVAVAVVDKKGARLSCGNLLFLHDIGDGLVTIEKTGGVLNGESILTTGTQEVQVGQL